MPGLDFAHAQDESESDHFAHVFKTLFAWRYPYGQHNLRIAFCYFLGRREKACGNSFQFVYRIHSPFRTN